TFMSPTAATAASRFSIPTESFSANSQSMFPRPPTPAPPSATNLRPQLARCLPARPGLSALRPGQIKSSILLMLFPAASTNFLAARNYGNAREQRFFRIGHYAVAKNVDHRGAPRSRRVVGPRAVHRSRMVKGTFSFFQFDGHGLEFFFQVFRQTVTDAVHFSSQNRFGQVWPLVASGNVIQAAVLARGIVQANPASEMRQGRRPCPVRIILVPGHHAAMPRR